MSNSIPPRWGWPRPTSSAARPSWRGLCRAQVAPRPWRARRLQLAAVLLLAGGTVSSGAAWVAHQSVARGVALARAAAPPAPATYLPDEPADVAVGGARATDSSKPALVLAGASSAAGGSRYAPLAAHAASAARDGGKSGIVLAAAAPASAPAARPLERPAVALLAARSEHPATVAVVPRPTIAAPRWSSATPTATTVGVPPPRGSAARSLAVQLTAYSASEVEGTAGGITASGARVRPGTVAVDPAVIPLGSKLRIDGLPGVYRAEDTGGGVRGAHVDVFMDSRGAALEFGRRASVRVEVLE